MRHVILIFVSVLCTISSQAQSNYSKGYEEGYIEGYCYDIGVGCVEPISPVSPVPRIGADLNSYKDGYNHGFNDGAAKQKSEVRNSRNGTRFKATKGDFVDDNIYNPLKGVDVNNIFALAQAIKESKGLAMEHLEDENYQAVANICYSGLQVSPNDDEFMLLLGYAYKESGNYKEAYKWLKKASRKRPLDSNLKSLVRKLKAVI